MLIEIGSEDCVLSNSELHDAAIKALDAIDGKTKKKVLILPPDFTRFHSKAGELTCYVYEYYKDCAESIEIMPALGTHKPMTKEQLEKMFPGVPMELFRVHDWRNDVIDIGEVPEELVVTASDGKVKEKWPAQLNKLVWEGGHDLVLSIGQVVPHEVLGMSNYNKNLLIGVGGSEAIHFSHFIGAVYGMERMMGRADNPLRTILDYATDKFIKPKLPLVYMQTVIGRDKEKGELVTRGFFASKDRDCFERAAALSLKVNFTLLDEPLKKVVVYLDPEEFKSTWLGNKSVYRTRMAIADDGDLIVLAPGVEVFGEDEQIDALIRKHGYRSTPEILQQLEESRDLMKNLSAAAHLIHGTSEGRFNITYCPGHLTKQEIESVGYQYAPLEDMLNKYDPKKLKDGFNDVDGEQIFYISNPAVGLWAYKGRFEESSNPSSTPSSSSLSTNFTTAIDSNQESSADGNVGGGPFKKPKIE